MPASDVSPPPLARGRLERAGEERARAGLLEEARSDPRARALVLNGDRAPLTGDRLHWVAPGAAPTEGTWAFLGRDEAGAPLLAVAFAAAETDPFPAPGGWAGLRVVGGSLPAADAAAFVAALSLGRWLLDAPFCPACGSSTEVISGGWARRCPSCGRDHFPRTDPAVIVAVTSAADPDRLLLGSNALWGADRYSCFAGFVEAGESLEEAVGREVREEAGVEVAAAEYRGSQAWPYPRSLMLGFRAQAADDDAAVADGEEIVSVRWFTRDEIGAGLRGEGDVTLPGSASIAHRLIADWHAER